jgi:hypothetical protein
MVNDFEWAIETPLPSLYEGAKFIINSDSEMGENNFQDGEYISFVIDSFGTGCIDSDGNNNIGKDVVNFQILENTQECVGKYKNGYFGEVELGMAKSLIEKGWWQIWEK